MAQPSELFQSRKQSEHLDSNLIELHAPPGKEQQQQHRQQQPALQPKTTPPPTHPGDADISRSCTQPVGNGARHVSAGGDDESGLDGGSTTANVHLNNRVPTDGPPAEWTDDRYGNRNETRYDGDTPWLTSPPMSNAQPPQGPPRQPMGYPSPTSYPPGMAPTTHYTFPPQPIPQPDPYRQAPTSLPSMRTLEHVPPQQPQHQPQAMPMNAHMAGPMGSTPPMGYYGVPTHAYNIHADPNAMRFAIPPGMADPRIALSGGRHKKQEIKRRTKTGCLTCRKRRIKCDEAHPTCNNCKKSKRDCLGYDPIFKQQQGPTVIQPAPNSQPAAPVSTLTSTPTLPSTTTAHPYQAQPPVVPSSYPPSVPSSITFDSPVSSTAHSVKTESGFDYVAAIDPALQGADLSTGAGTPPPQYPHTKAEGVQDDAAGQQYSKAKKMKVDELIALGGFTPPTPSSPPSASVIDECTKIYNEVYAAGLNLFFESKWYGLLESQAPGPNPIAAIRQNQQILALFTSFIKTIRDTQSANPTDMTYSSHLESSVIWALACLPGSLAAESADLGPVSAAPAEDSLLEVAHRVIVYETLVSGGTLRHNASCPPSASVLDPARNRELEFWFYLSEYLRESRSSPSAVDTRAREQILGLLRSLVDGRENRDVLYSIAVLREYTTRWNATHNEQAAPSHLEEKDPRCRLAVATRFIRDEAVHGTTNVVRRFAEIAYTSFVQPGVNAKMSRKPS